MVVPIPITSEGRRRTKYNLITFNGTQNYEPVLGYGTHGDFFAIQSNQVANGSEFPPR